MTDTTVWSSLGTLSIINYAEKHAERLERSGEPGLVVWSQAVRGSATDAKNAYAASRPLRALWKAATARKDATDDDLDATISGVSYDLLGPSLLKNNRDATEYRILFPEGNINFILEKTLRKSVHIVTSEVGTRKKASAYFPTIAESHVPEEEEVGAAGSVFATNG